MKTFNEVNKYYRFPLHISDWCNVYIETDDDETAFSILQDKPELFDKLVQKINEPNSISLDDEYEIRDDAIVSKSTGEGLLLVRGWGMLTGTCACNLPFREAADIQDSFILLCCERLNTKI